MSAKGVVVNDSKRVRGGGSGKFFGELLKTSFVVTWSLKIRSCKQGRVAYYEISSDDKCLECYQFLESALGMSLGGSANFPNMFDSGTSSLTIRLIFASWMN